MNKRDESKLANETWMRLYKMGTPVEIRHCPPGTLVIAYESNHIDVIEEWEKYFIMVVVGGNKSTVRVHVNSESWLPWIPGEPVQPDEKVVMLQPFNLDSTF